MAGYIHAAGAVLLAVILTLTLKQTNPAMAALLSVAVCALALMAGMSFLKPVIAFLDSLRRLGSLPEEPIRILLKVTGISVISEIAVLVCSDSGNSSMGQTLKILSTGTILYLSIPLFQVLLDLVQKILEANP